jgi:hypothetical protein
MDTAKLELAVQRAREAQEALDAALADVRAEAVAALRQDSGAEAAAAVPRVTGWSAANVRELADGRA